MIENRKEAAFIAAGIAMGALELHRVESKDYADFFEEHFERCFDETLQYRFHAEAFWIHQGGQGHEIFAGPWAEVFPSTKLALTLYCANVPVLAALIDMPKVDEAAGDPTKSRFESVNHDDDGGGTIYQKEDWAGQERANPEYDPSDEVKDDPGTDPELGSAENPLPPEALRPLDPPAAEDVTENTDDESQLHPNAEVVVNDLRGEGGDVVDDDEGEGEEGGGVDGEEEVAGDNPPGGRAPPAKSRKKKT